MTTTIILIITVIVSLLCFNNRDLFAKLLFNPYQVLQRKEYHRILSHTLVHGGVFHLFVNMFVLYMFGSVVEDSLGFLKNNSGAFHFAMLYIGGGIFATLPSFAKHRNNPGYNAVGASGAVAAVLFAYVLMYPTEKVYLYAIIPMYSIVFGAAYLFYEWYMDKRSNDNVAHDAHFYGALFGVIYTIFMDVDLLLDFGYLQERLLSH